MSHIFLLPSELWLLTHRGISRHHYPLHYFNKKSLNISSPRIFFFWWTIFNRLRVIPLIIICYEYWVWELSLELCILIIMICLTTSFVLLIFPCNVLIWWFALIFSLILNILVTQETLGWLVQGLHLIFSGFNLPRFY